MVKRTSGGRQYDSNKKLQIHRHPQTCMCLWNVLRVVSEKTDRSLCLCIIQVMSTTTYTFPRWMHSMSGRKRRYIGEVLKWYRGEDVGDRKRSELNDLVENLTCLNALEEKFWKSNQKVVMDDKSNQNVVMDGQFVENIVMDATIDPEVVMDLSIFKIGGWNTSQPSNQNLSEESIDENEPWLLIGIPNRDPFLVTTLCEFRSTHEEMHVTS